MPEPTSILAIDPGSERSACRRHQWIERGRAGETTIDLGTGEAFFGARVECLRCGKPRDPAISRRARNNRKRGGAVEREVAAALGLRKVGHHGGPEDVTGLRWSVQVKSRAGAAFPGWMAAELARLPRDGRTPLLVVAEAGHHGARKRRALVVLELADWVDLHGEVET